MCTISIYGLDTLTYELTVNENSDDGTMWCPIDVVTPIAGARNFLTLVLHLSLSSAHIHSSLHDATVGASINISPFFGF